MNGLQCLAFFLIGSILSNGWWAFFTFVPKVLEVVGPDGKPVANDPQWGLLFLPLFFASLGTAALLFFCIDDIVKKAWKP